MISQRLRQRLIILSTLIMVGSLTLIVLGTAISLFYEVKEGPVSDGFFSVFLETRLGDLIMGLIAGATLRTLVSIDARLERKI